MNSSVKKWINGKADSATFKIDITKVPTGHKTIVVAMGYRTIDLIGCAPVLPKSVMPSKIGTNI